MLLMGGGQRASVWMGSRGDGGQTPSDPQQQCSNSQTTFAEDDCNRSGRSSVSCSLHSTCVFV